MQIHSPDQIISFIENKGLSIKCVSFDVYDTLLRRIIAPPDQVKVPSAKVLVEILASHGIIQSVSDCLKTRELVTQHLRKAAVKMGKDPECHIREIVRAWLQYYLSNETADKYSETILETELTAESNACFPVEGMKQVIRKIKKDGKRTIFISDMYLGVREISGLLGKAGFDQLFDKGYVSADIELNKKSGRLFEYAINAENLHASAILHVGDNFVSDFQVPKKLGLKTIHLRDSGFENWAIRHRKLKKLSKTNSYWEGARWVEMTPPDANSRQIAKTDLGFGIGYFILGPVLVNFVHQVIDRIIQDRTELVLFPAREGFILREIFLRIGKKIGATALPPAEYIYLSRQSTFLASVNEVGDREIIRGLETRPTLRKILAKLSLEPSSLEWLARKCGFSDLDELIDQPLKNSKLEKFLSHPDFKCELLAKREALRDLLYHYLNEFNFWNLSRVAFVDVGWTGTIQESLALAFEERADWPFVDGYYIALLDRSKAPRYETKKSKFNGVFYDGCRSKNRTGIGRFTELFENATRAPHGTTLGYKRQNNGKIIPILNSSSTASFNAELLDCQLVASLQAGILDYTDRYASLLNYQVHSPKSHQNFVISLIDRLVRYPSKKEALTLKELVYTNDFGGLLFMPGPNPASPDLKNFSTKRTNPDRRYYVMWPEGFYSSTGIPGLTTLFNIYRTLFKRAF